MSSWTGFGSACADPVAEAGPARGQSPVGNVGGAGSREPLQGLDGVCRRVSRGSARSLAHGAVCVPQTGCGDAAKGAIRSVVVHRWFLTGRRYENFVLFEDISLGGAKTEEHRIFCPLFDDIFVLRLAFALFFWGNSTPALCDLHH